MRVLDSVQSRMGFVPATIQHEIDSLLSLPAPDEVQPGQELMIPRVDEFSS